MDKTLESQNETDKTYSFEKSGNFKSIGLINDDKFSKLLKVQSTNDIKQEKFSKLYVIKIFKLLKNEEKNIQYKTLEISELGAIFHNSMEIDDMEQNQARYISDLLNVKTINEVDILRSLTHQNILEPIEFKIKDNANGLWMLFNFFPTNIGEFFKRNIKKGNLITESFFKNISMQIIQAVSYLHENLIIHRNLKPDNIIFNESKNQILISGFGLCKKISFDYTINDEKNIGSLAYKPPDVLLGNKYYVGSLDVWSIGCIIVELIIGRVLFQGNNELEVLNSIYRLFEINEINEQKSNNNINQKIFSLLTSNRKTNLLINYIKNFSMINFENDDFYDLIQKMITIDPVRRITLEDCLKHSWFTKK